MTSPNTVIMRMDKVKEYFAGVVDVKRSYEAVSFLINLIEQDLKEYVTSPDFQKLPIDTQEDIAISRERAIRYWRIQLDDFMEKNTSAWINVAKGIRSEELNVALPEILKSYGVKPLKPETQAKPVVTPEKAPEEPVEKAAPSDEDILAGLIADQ